MLLQHIFRGVRPRRRSPVRSRPLLLLEELEPRIALAAVPSPPGHDPALIKEGDWYYLFNTNGLVSMQRSTDLIHWEGYGPVFDSVPAWARAEVPNATDIWAPDISYFDGLYHLYYSVSSFGSGDSAIGLATNVTLNRSSPNYNWVDHGMVIRSFDVPSGFNAIDPNAVFDMAG